MTFSTRTPLALILSSVLIAAGCGGGTPSSKDSIAVNPLPSGKLTLSGIVTDNPIINASVQMRVGSASFASGSPTGSSGDFVLEIESENPLALITAEALDAVNGVRLSAVIDTFEGCQAQATNGIVDGVMITNVTTAQKVLAERLATDGSIDSFNEFATIAAQIDATELLDLASALKVVIENIDGNILPSGHADTLALARAIADGSSNFFSDVETATPGALAEARDLLLSDGNATVPFTATDAAGVYKSTDDDFVYALFNNGTALADFYEDFLVPGLPSWALNDQGKVIVTFYGFRRQSDSLSALGQVGDLVHMVADYADNNGAPAGQLARNVRHYDFGDAFDATDLAGAWLNPESPDNQWVFEASGAGYRVDALTLVQTEPFTWTVQSDGRVRMRFTGSDNYLDIIRLAADEAGAAMALQVNRYGNQWSTLDVTGFERAASVPGS